MFLHSDTAGWFNIYSWIICMGDNNYNDNVEKTYFISFFQNFFIPWMQISLPFLDKLQTTAWTKSKIEDDFNMYKLYEITS